MTVLAWSNSLFAPFVFDDLTAIVANPTIRDLQQMLTDTGLFLSSPRRFLGYLSFAVNYHLGGLNPFGFHLVNLGLHCATALTLLGFCRIVTCHPKQSSETAIGVPLPLAAALLFASHPVQTQAVTYITQRFTVLAAFFYLLTLCCYVRGRSGVPRPFPWIGAAFLSALCALFSKEIACTLPVALLLLELFLLTGNLRRRLMAFLPFAALLLIPLVMLTTATDPELLMVKGAIAAGSPVATHQDYLITQIAVFATYLRLLVLPTNQMLDYDYPVYQALTAPPVAAGGALLLIIIVLGLLLYRRGTPHARLAGFGISLFLTALAVESFIPLTDVINEHRLYLPLAGAAMAAACLLQRIAAYLPQRWLQPLFFTVVITLAAVTWKRNLAWSDELLLWSDSVAKAPAKARPHYNFGSVLLRRGMVEPAAQEFRAALAINPDDAHARYGMGLIRATNGDESGAQNDFEAAIGSDPNYAEAYTSLGIIMQKRGDAAGALHLFREAVRLSPGLAEARSNLGTALAIAGDYPAAIAELTEALRLDPVNGNYRQNLVRLQLIRSHAVKAAE